MMTPDDILKAMARAGISATAVRTARPGLIRRVNTDTRSVMDGDLYVALRGERFDGNDFAPEAVARGAACVMVERPIAGVDAPQIVVPDGLRALGALAAWWRSKLDTRIIGVCGSNGKTTTTQMIAGILARACPAQTWFATIGNRNNEIGVPQMLLSLRPGHRLAVLEMGMNHVGEIAYLAQMVRPDIVVLTNAQREHQEFLSSVEETARENGAAILSLPRDGIAVLPADDPCISIWRTQADGRRVVDHGSSPSAVVAGTWHSQAQGMHMSVASASVHLDFHLALSGEHFARNALAAASAALAAGIEPADISAGLADFRPVSGRGTRHTLPGGARLIDDSYNANPDSVRAAIDALAGEPGWRVLVLGDMGEVGTQGAEFHREVGAYARSRGVDRMICLGDASRDSAVAFGEGASHCHDPEEAARRLREELARPGSPVALVKGSRFMRMERVFKGWLIEPGPAGPTGGDSHA